MKRAAFCFILVFCLSVPLFAREGVKEIGNLVIDQVPDVPQKVVERMAQYQNIRSASFSDWDPSGKGMLVSTRFGEAAQLHYVAAPAADRKQLTFFREPVASGRYSPHKDKRGFIFSMDTGGAEFFQIYWFDEEKGKHWILTDGKSRNESPVWSNAGDKIAFASTKRNGVDFDLHLMEGLEPNSARLVKEFKGQWNPIEWSSDDSQILLRNSISINESYIYALDLATAEMTQINPSNDGEKIAYARCRFARDGRGVYYTSDENSEFQRLVYYNLATKKKHPVTSDLNWDIDDFAVSPDGKTIAYTTNEGGIARLYIASTRNKMRPLPIELPKGVISGMKFDRAGARLGFSLSTPVSASDAYSIDVRTKKILQWTFSEAGGLNTADFVMPELIEYPTFDEANGKPRMIPAFYYRPNNESKKPFPVIIDIHGGPEGQSTASFKAITQYWVNELGAAVLVPNVRGSSGYGKTYLMLDNGFKREDSVKDIGKLLDWIAARPELDAKRAAVMGGSYGGYMTLASMTNFNDRLKCGVDTVGISNFVSFLESTKEYRRDLRRVEYGDERDPKMREYLISISPTSNAKKITKPLFVLQGKNDPRVPVTESEQMVKTVRGNGGTVWYLMAKDEGHGFRKKVNQEFSTSAIALFFEKYLLE